MRRFLIPAAAVFLTVAGAAQAHPKLVSVNPSANAVVAAPAKIELRFSEKLVPAFSKAEIEMAAMPGMGAMKVASTAILAPDGQTLIVTPGSVLSGGRYVVHWQVVSKDTHKVAGTSSFTVK